MALNAARIARSMPIASGFSGRTRTVTRGKVVDVDRPGAVALISLTGIPQIAVDFALRS
jgi:hypothetical protein